MMEYAVNTTQTLAMDSILLNHRLELYLRQVVNTCLKKPPIFVHLATDAPTKLHATMTVKQSRMTLLALRLVRAGFVVVQSQALLTIARVTALWIQTTTAYATSLR